MSAKDMTLEKAQQLFDFLLPHKPTLRPDELSDILGVTTRSILRAYECGELMGLGLNFVSGAKGERTKTRRIPRECAILYLAKHANYSPEEFEQRLLEVLAQQDPQVLLRVQSRLPVLIGHARSRTSR